MNYPDNIQNAKFVTNDKPPVIDAGGFAFKLLKG
jgi:hypothetical protein